MKRKMNKKKAEMMKNHQNVMTPEVHQRVRHTLTQWKNGGKVRMILNHEETTPILTSWCFHWPLENHIKSKLDHFPNI